MQQDQGANASNGPTDRTNRLVVVMDATFKVTNAYYF